MVGRGLSCYLVSTRCIDAWITRMLGIWRCIVKDLNCMDEVEGRSTKGNFK